MKATSMKKTNTEKTNTKKTNTKAATMIVRNRNKIHGMTHIRGLLCLLLALLCLGGCSPKEIERSDDDKIIVTMLYTSELPGLERLVETTYTDIDLQIETNAPGTIDGEMERWLCNGHSGDIVASTLAAGDVLNYLADMSADETTQRGKLSCK